MQLRTKWDDPNPTYEDVSEEDLETLHVYLVSEHPKRVLSENTKQACMAVAWVVVLVAWIAGFVLVANTPVFITETITVPARISPLEIRATVAIVPTGKRGYPATQATGTLTLYNGSFLTQQVPAGFILTTSNGTEVVTDQAATIPPAAPPALGVTAVTAHASVAGIAGDIAAYTINQTYGAALYIKNLSAFTGGQDAYSTTYATKQDISNALDSARAQLSVKQPIGLTTGPCTEKASQKAFSLSVVWMCQYVTYSKPVGAQVLSVRVVGHSVVLRIKRQREGRWKRY
jgi:hypothetical protein